MTASNLIRNTGKLRPGATAPVVGWRAHPERVVLAPRPGVQPSSRPPVRIFLGTEPAQYRIERVFVWSIEQVRDPARSYEIYLMRELAGFDQRRWLTGFTNYRFAIPHLAGGKGRAIYNDCDQIYLCDPALLFDQEMGAHGFMSINDHDTSVMLIDCERMIKVWSLESARTGKRKQIEAKARAISGLWGPIDAGWNARDEEYSPATSKCVHFTTIHTQPWLPFPERYVYQRNPIAHLFFDRERSADQAGFQLFSAAHPSDEYQALIAGQNGEFTGLELIPSQDVPWIVDELFRNASSPLKVRINVEPKTRHLPDGRTLQAHPRGAVWWRDRFELASRHHPNVHWELELVDSDEPQARHEHLEGGRRDHTPTVWVLEDDKTGHSVQSVGLAEALGWPYQRKQLRFNVLNRLSNLVIDSTRIGLKSSSRRELQPPWPDLVISTGRKAAPIARWIAAQSNGHTRLVHLGRKGGEIADRFDVVVGCAHFRMPQHRNRVELAAPLNSLSPERLAAAAEQCKEVFVGAPQPRVVLVIGGSTANHELTPELGSKIGREVRAFTEAAGGKLFVITSPRTGDAASDALAQTIGESHHLHRWRAGEKNNPYVGFLAQAEVIVVTGESESMLSEACSTGAPVYIYTIPERPAGLRQRLREWVTQRAYSRPRKKNKGTVRPQQGLERICAQLIARGLVRPPRDLGELHAALIRAGAAHRFGEPLTTQRHKGLHELDAVVERVHAMFGLG